MSAPKLSAECACANLLCEINAAMCREVGSRQPFAIGLAGGLLHMVDTHRERSGYSLPRALNLMHRMQLIWSPGDSDDEPEILWDRITPRSIGAVREILATHFESAFKSLHRSVRAGVQGTFACVQHDLADLEEMLSAGFSTRVAVRALAETAPTVDL